jgi:uncharacterized protein GlcG (DUF336 family)
MKNGIIAIMGAATLFMAPDNPAFAASNTDEPLTVNIKRVTLDVAMRIGKAAIDKCRAEGVQITVTVVDRGGHEQIVMRDTLAMDASIPISKKKAYTAMVFNTPTSGLIDRFKGAYSVPKVDPLIIAIGGIPITIGSNILGGIGVSGAPSGLTDEACALAGLKAVHDDLNMQME